MTVEPLVSIENSMVALEVQLRPLGNANDQQSRLLELHSRHIFHNIAGALHSIRDELSGYLYRNAPTCEDSPNE